ncbi:MAG: hypothetical protein Q8K55_10935 [Gemmatimonadaceae bacterium]|nr:hypothetical protein [Gemmatimonadaceae bacterium]
MPRCFGAQILALPGRKDDAVAMLRDELNNGWRPDVDEPLEWSWAPPKDDPPLVALVKRR